MGTEPYDKDRWKRERDTCAAFDRSYHGNMRLSGTELPNGQVEIPSKTASEWAQELAPIPNGYDLSQAMPDDLRVWFLNAGRSHSLASVMMSHARIKQDLLELRMKVDFAEACRDFRNSYKKGGEFHDPKKPNARPSIPTVEAQATIATQDLAMMIGRFRLEYDFFANQAKSLEKNMTALKAALDSHRADPTNYYSRT